MRTSTYFQSTLALLVGLTACGASGDTAPEPGGDAGQSSGGPNAGDIGGSPGTGGSGNGAAGSTIVNAAGNGMGGGGASGGSGMAGGGNGGSGNGQADAGHGVVDSGKSAPPLPCDSLPMTTQWENISPPGQSDTTALIVDPFQAGVVWLGTRDNGLYKSTNCGAEFTHVSTGRNATEFNTPGQGLLSMVVDPQDQGVIYVFKYGGHGVFKSTNGGVDWDQLIAPDSEVAKAIPSKYIDAISMDPTDHHHLVVSNHVNCNAPYDPTCQAETTDAGATWRVFKSAPGTNWEEGAGPWVINATTWLYAGLHLWLTTDRGNQWKNLDPDPAAYWGFNGGEVETHPIPRDANGNYYLTAGQGIVRSTDGGLSWSLIPNSGGRSVGFVVAGDRFYSIDQWTPSVHTASVADPTKWSAMPAPAIPAGQGCPYLDYDAAHHVLYASCFGAGAWRIKE